MTSHVLETMINSTHLDSRMGPQGIRTEQMSRHACTLEADRIYCKSDKLRTCNLSGSRKEPKGQKLTRASLTKITQIPQRTPGSTEDQMIGPL